MTPAREGTLVIVTSVSGPDEGEIRAILHRDGFQIASCSLATSAGTEGSELKCEVRWRSKAGDTEIPGTIRRFRAYPGVLRIEWSPKVR